MAFKMKGNPMKRNFGIGAKPMTKINRGDDKGNPTAAFQKHDGKTFDDPGFMDSHFPSGAPRPMKMKHKSATKLMKEKSPVKDKQPKNPKHYTERDDFAHAMVKHPARPPRPDKPIRKVKAKTTPVKLAKVGKKAISMAEKPVTATAKAMSKRKAKRAAKKAGKGNVVTTVQSATKMKKKSAMKLETEKKLKKTVKRGFIEGASEMTPKVSRRKPTYTDEFGKTIKVGKPKLAKKKSPMKSAKDDLSKLKARAEKAGVNIREEDGTINMGKARAKVRAAEGRKGDVKKLNPGQTMYRDGKKLSKEEANKILARGRTYSRK